MLSAARVASSSASRFLLDWIAAVAETPAFPVVDAASQTGAAPERVIAGTGVLALAAASETAQVAGTSSS